MYGDYHIFLGYGQVMACGSAYLIIVFNRANYIAKKKTQKFYKILVNLVTLKDG